MMNRDKDGDGKCDFNCDTNKDGWPDKYIDINGDDICDYVCDNKNKESKQSRESKQSHESKQSTKPVESTVEEEEGVVVVNYIETNIVDLRKLYSVDDDEGLQNPPQRFSICNDPDQLNGMNYTVNYTVNIVEMNSNIPRKIDKKYIKYRYTKTDKNGNVTTSDIGRLSALKESNGKLLLVKDSQQAGDCDYYSVVFWIASDAGNDQQTREFLMAFKVEAGIMIN